MEVIIRRGIFCLRLACSNKSLNDTNCFIPKLWRTIDHISLSFSCKIGRQIFITRRRNKSGNKRPSSERSVCLPLSLYCQIDGCIWKHFFILPTLCQMFLVGPQRKTNDFLHKKNVTLRRSWRIFFRWNLRWVSVWLNFNDSPDL